MVVRDLPGDVYPHIFVLVLLNVRCFQEGGSGGGSTQQTQELHPAHCGGELCCLTSDKADDRGFQCCPRGQS